MTWGLCTAFWHSMLDRRRPPELPGRIQARIVSEGSRISQLVAFGT
jgi:hypothetical protein